MSSRRALESKYKSPHHLILIFQKLVQIQRKDRGRFSEYSTLEPEAGGGLGLRVIYSSTDSCSKPELRPQGLICAVRVPSCAMLNRFIGSYIGDMVLQSY